MVGRLKRAVSQRRVPGSQIERLESRWLLAGITVQRASRQRVVFNWPGRNACNLQFGGCSGSVTFQGPIWNNRRR